MRLIIIVLFVFSFLCASQAQKVKVIEASSGKALAFASVRDIHSPASVMCNNEGIFDMSAFNSNDTLYFSMLGYKSLRLSYNEVLGQDYVVTLSSDAFHLKTFVVSGTGWKQPANTSPSKIESISLENILLNNPQTAADLLSLSHGVYIQKSQQGGGSPMIRGFSANRLLYTVDGVRMNTAIYRSGNIQNVISLDPFAIESSEVLFGAGSVIYGSDAIGGVMAFQTLKAKTQQEPSVSGRDIYRYSSANNELTGHIDAAYNTKKWAGLTSYSRNKYSHLTMGKNGPDEYLRTSYVKRIDNKDIEVKNEHPREQINSTYSQFNIMQKVSYTPNEHWDINYGFHYSETSDYDRYDRHLRRKDDRPRYGEWSYGPQIWLMNNLSILHTKDNPIYDNMSLRLAHQEFKESRISRNFNDPIREIRKEQVDALSLNLDFTKQLGKHKLYYGLEGVNNKVGSTGVDQNIETQTSTLGPSRYPQAISNSLAAYAYDQYQYNDQLKLSAGLRYSYFKIDADFDTTFYPFPYVNAKLNNGALTGNLAAIVRPNDNWIIRANISTAFRAPNVDDIGKVFDSEPGAVVVPNPNLDAEYAYNAELGLAHTLGENIKVEGSFYYTYLSHALVRRDYSLHGNDSIMYDGEMSKVQAIQNAAKAYVYGAQLGLEVNLPYHLNFSANYNYQKGEEELEDKTMSPSRHVAPSFFDFSLNYKHKKIIATLYSQYFTKFTNDDLAISEQSKHYLYAIDTNGLPYCPAWYTINLKTSYRFTKYVTANIGIENITNMRYRPYSSGIAGAGRSLITSVRFTF